MKGVNLWQISTYIRNFTAHALNGKASLHETSAIALAQSGEERRFLE